MPSTTSPRSPGGREISEAAIERYKACLTYARQQRGKQKDLSTLDSLIGQGRVLMMQGKYDEA